MIEFEIQEARRSQPEGKITISGPRSLQNTRGALTAFQTPARTILLTSTVLWLAEVQVVV